jgi:ABC-2 type transport system ATP-binding protein
MHITIAMLTKVYRGGVRALDGIEIDLDPGMTGLLGANGAGKTTLMRILTGIITPTSGSVSIDGHDPTSTSGRRAVTATLGYLPQEIEPYPDLTGREFLDYLALLKGVTNKAARRRQVGALLEQVSLDDVAKRRIKSYSGGMKRRLGIAQALLGNPRLIIVDEPTAGLDPEERMRFRALLASLGAERTVVLSTHILDDVAQTCERTAVLGAGRLVYHGATSGLVEAARGRTFSLTTRGAPPAGDHDIVNAQSAGSGTLYRIVTDNPPPGGVPAEPTIEDGYVALMRTTRNRAPSEQR